MAIAARIRSFDLRQLLILSGIFMLRPRLIIPTYRATRETVFICNERFGKAHHKNNKTNAFRHALWNFLIAKLSFKVVGTPEKALEWSERITDLHEKLSPNSELAKIMDLHNNYIGRKIFKDLGSNAEVVPLLLKYMENAVKAENPEEIKNAGDQLVYIE